MEALPAVVPAALIQVGRAGVTGAASLAPRATLGDLRTPCRSAIVGLGPLGQAGRALSSSKPGRLLEGYWYGDLTDLPKPTRVGRDERPSREGGNPHDKA